MTTRSISIILEQFKKEHITEEEVIELIEDLYNNRINYIPYYWPQITYTDSEPKFLKYETTCKID